MRTYPGWLAAAVLIALVACGPKASSIHGNTEGYDFDHPKVVDMPTTLGEISGLWYYAKDNSLFAIEDEDGFLYKIFPTQPDRILRWRFHGHGDFEDVCMVNGAFYILRSDGSVFVTSIPSGDAVQSTKYELPESGNEFESLYYDDSLKLIILVCKDCKADDKKTVSTWAFNPATNEFTAGPYEIDANRVSAITADQSRFKPSAATINPFTGQLWLLSSVNKLIVVASREGGVIQAYPLNPGIYKQPEGIAFGSDRTLYISNESAGKGSANILVMPYRPQKK
jgi:uncharacterized protein YjiK